LPALRVCSRPSLITLQLVGNKDLRNILVFGY
jgi:hypothetical protein